MKPSSFGNFFRNNKFKATKTVVDGIVFHSKKEARRYQDLVLLERSGEIQKLELQVRYPLVVNQMMICHYVADFRYSEKGRVVVEDTKGFRTPEYRIKAKLMFAIYGISILET